MTQTLGTAMLSYNLQYAHGNLQLSNKEIYTRMETCFMTNSKLMNDFFKIMYGTTATVPSLRQLIICI